jgi:hypothetical protein
VNKYTAAPAQYIYTAATKTILQYLQYFEIPGGSGISALL